MKYNGFYFWMFKSPMKKVLAEKYDKKYAAETMKKSMSVYPLLRRMLPAIRRFRRKPCRR